MRTAIGMRLPPQPNGNRFASSPQTGGCNLDVRGTPARKTTHHRQAVKFIIALPYVVQNESVARSINVRACSQIRTAMPWTPLISRPTLLFRSPDHGVIDVLEEFARRTSPGTAGFLCAPLDRNWLVLPQKLYSCVCQIIHPPRLTPCHASGSSTIKPSGVAYPSFSQSRFHSSVRPLMYWSVRANLPATPDDCLDHFTCHLRASEPPSAVRRSYTEKSRRPDEHRDNFCIQKGAEDL